MEDVILRAEGITKVFPGTVALNRVDFHARAGSVNILVGENGAGKSTLMKIIAGVEQPSDGKLFLNGEEVSFRSPIDAAAMGIGIIYQEIDLCPNLSVADNIFLTREIAPNQVINFRKQRQIARDLLRRLEHDIDPDVKVGELGVSSQQIVAIAKALLQNVKVLIMDEPTSALSTEEVAVLFRVIRELKSNGVSIIYISHRLEELLQIGDYITVLRDGMVQAEERVSAIDVNWIVEKMVGRSLTEFLPREAHASQRPVLTVEHLRYPKPEGGFTVNDVSFTVHSGEIVGLYGLMGAGRTELFECLMGLHPEAVGDIVLEEQRIDATMTVDERINQGVVLVPEDRQAFGIVQSMSVAENITLASLARYARLGVLPGNAGDTDVQKAIKDLAIRVSVSSQLITALSGGNQQKVVLGKALLTAPKILLMDEPTRGIDVNAKTEIYSIMNELARSGMCIFFASSELKEITALSDRVLVLSRGKLAGEFIRGQYTESELVKASALDVALSTHS